MQILTQRQGGDTPVYELVEQRGEPHAPTFVMRATLDGAEIGRGEGHSKQAAQQKAAQARARQTATGVAPVRWAPIPTRRQKVPRLLKSRQLQV